MQNKENQKYEQSLRVGIDNLMERWKAKLAEALGENFVPDRFIEDGFYPNYTQQKCRILFIGREAYTLEGISSYIDFFLDKYRTGLSYGHFHYRMLCIAYGILNGCERWEDIPEPSTMRDKIGKAAEKGGFSFAFMNANKLSNESGETATDFECMNKFLTISMPFLREEIALLHPDVVISMNLNWNSIYSGGLNCQRGDSVANNDVVIHKLPDETPFLDTWHFSARKSPGEQIYAPIVEALKHPSVGLWSRM